VELYPAIDIRGGRVARVPRGLPDDPLDLLLAWGEIGAQWVHLVDLDRAYGTGDNRTVIQRLLARSVVPGGGRIRVQIGGGLASAPEIGEVLEWGAARVVVGAALAANEHGVRDLVGEYGAARLAAAVEVRDGRLAPRSGGAAPDVSLPAYLERIRRQAISTLVYTDVSRDGALGGPDVEGARNLSHQGTVVILSGGVGSLDDLKRARAAGLAGVIVGRALHEGRFTLAQALACLAD
jgi:phosphoribosylformimino-5-aminoimidazole carboxamide ribonucleotide (ProFAR) isomerase